MAGKEIAPGALDTEVARLGDLMQRKGIDTSTWQESAGNKSLGHLATEILQGDAILENETTDEELRRVTHVVNLYVYAIVADQKLQLVEDKQVFVGGKERKRGMKFLSEKKAVTEPLDSACRRALQEEIHVEAATDIERLEEDIVEKDSPSFPGLVSKYIVYKARTTLAPEQYRAEGYTEIQSDKTTYFVWQPVLEETEA